MDAPRTNKARRRPAMIALSLILALLAGGCASYPMGLSKAEWEALPPERQADLRAEQYRIDAEERARREEAARQRDAAAAAAEEARRERVAEARANARYRDIVVVTLQGGALRYGDRDYPLQPAAFDLVKGERRQVELVGYRGDRDSTLTARETWWVSFAEDGNSVVLNDGANGKPLILVDRGEWEDGQTTQLGSLAGPAMDEVNLDGMTATIRYKPAPGMPERLILEKR